MKPAFNGCGSDPACSVQLALRDAVAMIHILIKRGSIEPRSSR
jgi:hypothetical protein